MQALPAGSGYFSGGGDFILTACDGGPCDSPTGSFQYWINIDFANQNFGGSGSGAWIQAADPGTDTYLSENFNINSQNFIGASGTARYIGFYYSDWENAWADFTLKDFGGISAGQLEAKFYFDDGWTEGYGTNTGPRAPVLDWTAVQGIGSGTGWLAGSAPFQLGICNDNNCGNPTGSFQYGLFIDFGAQTLGGNESGAGVLASDIPSGAFIADGLEIPSLDFSAMSGAAVFGFASNSGNFRVDFSLKDVGNVAALGAEVQAYYNDGWSNTGWGSSSADLAAAPSAPADGLSTWDEVRRIHGGTGQYLGSGHALTPARRGDAPSGSFDFDLQVNFGARTFFGSSNMTASNENLVSSAGTVSDSLSLSGDFFSLAGNAVVSGVSSSGNYTLDVSLKNDAGQAAALADAVATFADGLGTVGAGAVVDVPVCTGACIQ